MRSPRDAKCLRISGCVPAQFRPEVDLTWTGAWAAL